MRLIRRMLALLPSRLPMGMTEFDAWSDDILDLYELPNNDSTKFALATSVMHLPATDAYKPKEYFGRILLKGAATQIAYAQMQAAKARQEAKVAEEKRLAEEKAALDAEIAKLDHEKQEG